MIRLSCLFNLTVIAFTVGAALPAQAQNVRYPQSTGDPREDAQNQSISQLQQQVQALQKSISELQTAANAMLQCGAQGKVYNGRQCQDAAGAAVTGGSAAGSIPGATPRKPATALPF